MEYDGTLYRALNPIWARAPLSGEGAARFGGRFNPKGMPALYTSLLPETAMREANQIGAFQPITLVAYRATITQIFDSTDPIALSAMGMTPTDLADQGWRDIMLTGKTAPTQRFAQHLKTMGHNGMLVPSYIPNAQASDRNLVLWVWSNGPSSHLELIDDHGRLS